MPKKRGNNDGSIRQRANGAWEARYVAGYLPDGKPDRKSLYASSQEEIQKKLREVLRQLDRDEYVQPNRITVGQWLDTWYTTYGLPRWREKTAAVHRDNIRLHVKPALGQHLLQRLRTDHIQAFINVQIEKGISPATIRKQMEPLKAALKQACENNLLLRNPADNVKLPPLESPEIEFLSIDEQKALLQNLPDNTTGRALRFIVGTGLRASELCGLQWGDIGGDHFTIKRSAQYVYSKKANKQEKQKAEQVLSIASTKTKAGRRTIPLTSTTKGILADQKAAQRRERLEVGDYWRGEIPGSAECHVFSSEAGTVLDRSNLARTLRASLKAAGLKSRGIHALRHTFATNGVRAGIDLRTLSEILGHTKVAFTMQLYVHSDMAAKLAGLQAIEKLM